VIIEYTSKPYGKSNLDRTDFEILPLCRRMRGYPTRARRTVGLALRAVSNGSPAHPERSAPGVYADVDPAASDRDRGNDCGAARAHSRRTWTASCHVMGLPRRSRSITWRGRTTSWPTWPCATPITCRSWCGGLHHLARNRASGDRPVFGYTRSVVLPSIETASLRLLREASQSGRDRT